MSGRLGAGLRIVFGLDLDGGAWPGPIASHGSNAGEAWLGPRGLLERLELELGVPARPSSPLARAACLVPRLHSTAGFWSASARADPLATAERLLDVRDALALEGWTGQPVSTRLASLWTVTEGLPPGHPDRLAFVAGRLSRQRVSIAALGIAPGRLPRLWERVVDALGVQGIDVARLPDPSRALIDPSRRVDLLRSRGPVEAAEESAVWLASGALDGTLVIGATPLLDEALRRHGLPTVGARATPYENPYQAVLPTALALAFAPVNPRSVLDLLELSPSPVPPSIARWLRRALGTWPSTSSAVWRDALLRGEAELGPTLRAAVAARVRTLLTPAVKEPAPCPRSEIVHRAALVRAWLDEELSGAEGTQDERVAKNIRAALIAVEAFGEALGVSEAAALSVVEVGRLAQRAASDAPGVPRRVAEAGVAAVSAPGGVLGPVPRVLWWSFSEPDRSGLSAHLARAERAALVTAGVRVRQPWEELADEDERARQAVRHATEAVVLVRPERDEAGRPCSIPALALELGLPTAGKFDTRARLELGPAAPTRKRARSQALPVARRAWSVRAGAVSRRERESASSLGSLLGCSFRWALRYGARVGDRRTTLAEGPTLNGLLAHDLLGRALVPVNGGVPPDPAAIFDAEAPHLAAPLYIHGQDAERARVRAIFIASVQQLREILSGAGATVVAAEVELRDPDGFVVPLEGRPDVVLGPSPVVVDFKWGSRRRHEEALARGTALQLAVYAHLVRRTSGLSTLPAVAYYVMSAARFLASQGAGFPGAWNVDGPPLDVTLEALRRAVSITVDGVGRGELEARGVLPSGDIAEDTEDALTDAGLSVAPPCWSCAFDGLCGRAFRSGGGA